MLRVYKTHRDNSSLGIKELPLLSCLYIYISNYHRVDENVMIIGSKNKYCYSLQNERHE